MKPLRVVLDTNVLVSALMSPLGNPAKIYRMFLTGVLVLVYSEGIIAEYKDVLYRPYLHIDTEDADKVFRAIHLCGERVDVSASTFFMVDEDDRIFFDTARSAGAYLITGNMRHYPSEPFVVTPAEFLAL